MAWPQASIADYASADPSTLAVVVAVAIIAALSPLLIAVLLAWGLRTLWRIGRAFATLPAPRSD